MPVPNETVEKDLTKPLDPAANPSLNPENDADHQIRLMIARRKKPEEVPAEKPAEGGEKAEVKTLEPTTTEGKPDVGELLDAALKFRKTPKKEAAPAAIEKPAEEKPVKPAAAPAAEEGEEAPKTVVRRKAPAIDPLKVATAAATAATTAAVKAIGERAKAPEPEPDMPSLSDADRAEYEVVQYMANTNPKFKGADRVFLANADKAYKYASAWETRNPGKPFDAEDEEHNEFFDSIKQPYSPHELRRAEQEMVAETVAKRKSDEHVASTNEKLKSIESENARLKLAPKVESTMAQAIGFLTESVGGDIVAILKAGGPKKLQEEDPEADAALRDAIKEVAPIIQAIVELEESEGAVAYNAKNPAHRRYADILGQKEIEYAGVVDPQGRSCVSRAEYNEMTPAQRTQHYFLTPENIMAEIISEEAQKTSNRITEERNRIEKAALRRGFVKAKDAGKSESVAQPANQPNHVVKESGAPAPIKPISPSSNSGAKIDVKEPGTPASYDKVFDNMVGTLFQR